MKRAYPYRNLARETFDEVLAMLSEGIASQRGRYGAYLHHDRINHKLRARRGARLAAITSGGAIPDNALFSVVAEPEGATSEPSMKISPSKAWRETSCCWETHRGVYVAWSRGRRGCWSKMRTARRPPCLSGVEKLRRAPLNFRSNSANCAKKSATACPA